MALFDRPLTQKKTSGLVEVGVVWKRTTKENQLPYFAIQFADGVDMETLEAGRELQLWPVTNAKSEKAPAFRVLLAPESEEQA